jgi:predicted ribosome quality control (RQC) complex YloA/Tae2 family protein
MPVRYDPLLTAALAQEIRARWEGVRVASLALDPARRVGELRFEDGSALLATLHPQAGQLLAVEPLLSAEGLRFRRLFLSAVEAPLDERALLLTLSDASSNPRHRISAELQTNQWNLLFLSPRGDAQPGTDQIEWRIDRVLWRRVIRERRLEPGATYAAPANPRRGAARPRDVEAWMASLASVEPADRRGAALREWAYLSALNIDWVLGTAVTDSDESALREAFSRYESLLEECSTGGAWLLERTLGSQPYASSLEEPGAVAMPSLLDAMQASTEAAGGVGSLLALGAAGGEVEPETDDEAAHLGAALASRVKRIERRLAALEREREAARSPEEPRLNGQLILAHKPSIRRGIPTEIAENERRLETLRAGAETLAGDGPSEELWELVGRTPASGREPGRAGPEPRLPYHRFRSTGGLEIRVGRGARDNDALTLHHSSPEDIWMHARQVQGAHVILRWGRKEENPAQRDLLEAATVAAVHSGARHSGTAAVNWTRRKYVRKPRKSPPGRVVAERVQTVFVEPDEGLVKRLRLES